MNYLHTICHSLLYAVKGDVFTYFTTYNTSQNKILANNFKVVLEYFWCC